MGYNNPMSRLRLLLTYRNWLVPLAVIGLLAYQLYLPSHQSQADQSRITWWEVQSVDTMKFSRDLSREKVDDLGFDQEIDEHVSKIAQVGATHVAIGTPYDEEFLPFLRRWVDSARRHNLKVWFRGNWSGWQQWFDYPSITREEHLAKTEEFIIQNTDLFADGDIFGACPECENGGPGDPRSNGDLAGHREFLINLYQVTKQGFKEIGKQVKTNYFSMNGDVARLVMDQKTTAALDGIVVVDHYVASPQQLANDLNSLAKQSGGRVVLGEFGAPIPDIHGQMSAEDQAGWIEEALRELSQIPQLVGINYWVGVGGSTQIWEAGLSPRPAVEVIRSFYQLPIAQGLIRDQRGRPIAKAEVATGHHLVITGRKGRFQLAYLPWHPKLSIKAEGFREQELDISSDQINIVLVREAPGWWTKLLEWFLSWLS